MPCSNEIYARFHSWAIFTKSLACKSSLIRSLYSLWRHFKSEEHSSHEPFSGRCRIDMAIARGINKALMISVMPATNSDQCINSLIDWSSTRRNSRPYAASPDWDISRPDWPLVVPSPARHFANIKCYSRTTIKMINPNNDAAAISASRRLAVARPAPQSKPMPYCWNMKGQYYYLIGICAVK